MTRAKLAVIAVVASVALATFAFMYLAEEGRKRSTEFKQTNPILLTHDVSFLKDGTMIDLTIMQPVTKGVVEFNDGAIWQVENAIPVCLAGNKVKVMETHPLLFLPIATLLVIGLVLLIPRKPRKPDETKRVE
jgi:hypothetical protein